MNFEEKNERLKKIIDILQDKTTSLNDATKLFEEGVKLSKECLEELNKEKGKIIEIKEIIENTEE